MDIKERVEMLRSKMKDMGLKAYCVPSSDPHQSEYLPENYKTRAFISGFTGSAGTALVTDKEAILWTDGRYFLQAEKQLQGTPFVLYKMGEPGVPTLTEYLAKELKDGDKLGFDGKVVSLSMFEDMKDKISNGVQFVSDRDLVGEIWNDRPLPVLSKAFVHGKEYSGEDAKERIEKVKDIKKFTNYIAEYNIYGKKEILMWDDTDKENKKYLYLYVFFDDEKALKEDKDFTEYLIKLKTDIENNVENEKRVEDYRKYFDIKVEKENIIAVAKDDIIEKHMKKYGYFSLISNENLEAREILSIYRQKDVAEKAFHNIKDRLDARRLRVSSKPTMDGKIFVTFVSLVMLSYIKNKMSEKELYKKYTTQELLDELDLIESYERGNEKLKLGEVTKKQKEIFKYMDIKFPEELL